MLEELIHGVPITYLMAPVYVLAILAELIIARFRLNAKYEARDTAVTVGMVFVASFERVFAATVYLAVLTFFYHFRLFDIPVTWGALALCFLLDDFVYYWKHRLWHRIRWGWASHVNHHSSQHYNLSVALRQTPTSLLTGTFLLYGPIALLGFHPALIIFCGGVNLVYQFFIHTETVGKLPRWIEAVMNTPSHHRVHHATNPRYLDANYAGTFIIWDRMFGTFVEEDENETCTYGIVKNLRTWNLFIQIFHEWIGIGRDIFRPGLTTGERLKYAFMPPGWSHDGSRKSSDMIKRDHVLRHPEMNGQPGLPRLARAELETARRQHPAK